MRTSAENIQIFYEISMSIGRSLDIGKMLRQSLSTYLKRLNCSAGGILQMKEEQDGTLTFEQIYSIPRSTDNIEAYKFAMQNISLRLTKQGLSEFKKGLPINGHVKTGEYFHVLDLPNFGLIILIKNGEDFEPFIINSLKPLNMKLANACFSCKQNEELERSHDELRISEIKFRNFSKTAPVALTRFNLKENKYDFVNDEFTRQSGYSLEEFEKLSPEELDKMMYVDDRQRVYDIFKKWKDEGYKGVKRIDYRIENKERGVLWLDTYLYADFNESREPISINQICVDVTEQKSVGQSLIRSEERYRTFIAQSTEGIYRLEFEEPINTKLPEKEIVSLIYKHGYIAECNDVFAKMYGYKNSTSIKGIKLVEIHGGGNNPENVDAFKEFINSGYRVNNTETHEIDKEGNSVYVLNNSFGMIEQGMLLRIWGTQNDITKQKEILEQNRKLSRAVEQSSASIIITDSKGVIEYVNRKFCDTTLYNFDEVIGKQVRTLKPGKEPIKENKELIDTIFSGKDWSGEYLNRRKNGGKFWEHASISSIKDSNGKITNFIAIAEDITERKKIEKELLSAKEKAEDASKAKSQFLENMSHEFRTPLNGVIGMTQLLSLTGLSQEQKDYIEMVKYSSEILFNLINDILDYSMIESGMLKMKLESFNIKELVRKTSNILNFEAKKKELTLEVNFKNDFRYNIKGDSQRIKQILMHLIANAIKFTEKGKVIVNLFEENRINNKVFINLSVTDTGIGIPQDKIGVLFESFTQLDSSSTKVYKGAGLGLSIVKRLVDMIGGKITIESIVNQGSTFTCKMPFELDYVYENKKGESKEDGSSVKKGSYNILVVEDDFINQKLFNDLLIKKGYKVSTVDDGNKIFPLIEKINFDLIIMDIQLFGMDGFTATSVLRKKEKETGGHIPVIGMTAFAMQGDREKCLGVGMDDYLPKPFDRDDFYNIIEKYLSRSD